jgi:uroporphyrinogen decarboxylase
MAYSTYAYDMMMVFIDTVVEAEAMGCRIERPEDDNAFCVGPPRSTPRPADPEKDGRMPVVLGAIARLRELAGDDVPILGSLKGPFSLASFLGGFEDFLEWTIVDKDRAHAALKLALENQLGFAEAIIRAGAVPFIGDPVASGSLVSPEVFREFAQPYLERLVRHVHRFGTRAGLHVCGNTRSVTGDLAATGADVLSLDEVDLGSVRQELGPGALLMGNVPTGLVHTGTAGEVFAAAQACLAAAGPRLILSTACDVPADAPPDNVKALVRAAREA